jgi:beta-galactosidase
VTNVRHALVSSLLVAVTTVLIHGSLDMPGRVSPESEDCDQSQRIALRTYCFVIRILCIGSILCPAVALAQGRHIQSLDGVWQIVFDAKQEGRAGGWTRVDQFPSARQREIAVPSCWELTEKDYEGVAYYRRTFRVPAEWEGKIVRLHFGAVNFRAEVWLNDQAVGFHEGGFTPFEFRVEGLLQPGAENTLILRVVGPVLLQKNRIDDMGPMETPQWRGAIAGGIWQTVRLIATDDIYVKQVFIEPRIADDTASLHFELVHSGEESVCSDVAIALRLEEQLGVVVAATRETLRLHPGVNQFSRQIAIPGAKYWSPSSPHLYRTDVTVTNGTEISDQWTERFGLREFTIRDGRFHLNGQPLYLKATFFEGLYPRRLAYPDSRAMVRREIQLAKDAGFNMIRPWRKPPPPMWLDLAEELGVLTVGSMAIECMDFPVETARLPMWVENEVRESILRDRNRACVVQWELFNELKRPVLKQMLHPMAMLARQLDPTRLILDESGGWAQGASMYLPYEFEPTKFNDIHNYPGQQVNDTVYEKLLLTGSKSHEEMRAMGLQGNLPGRNVVPGLMTYFSELGYGSLPDLVTNNQQFAKEGNPSAPPTVYHRRLAEQHTRALEQSGFEDVYSDLQQFCLDQQILHGVANKRMIEAVRCNPQVKGYCIHALTAGDWIMGAGLLDLFRNPKSYAYEGTKAANQPRIVSIRVRPRNVYAQQGTRIEIAGVNDLDAVVGELRVIVRSDDGEVVFSQTSEVDLVSGLSRLFNRALDTNQMQGSYEVQATLTTTQDILITENRYQFDVFGPEDLRVPERPLAVVDPFNALKPFLRRVKMSFIEFNPEIDRSLPVLVSRTEAKTARQRELFRELTAFAQAGGTVVYLQGGGPRVPWGKAGPASSLLPMKLRIKRAAGHWMCIPRIVHDHPVFHGLPTNCMMGAVYENVWSQSTLLDVDRPPIVGTIGFDWFPDFDLSRRHFYGPGDVWWGSDLAVVPIGSGRCILSQLRLVENLGQDPVAEKILFNLIDWIPTSSLVSPIEPPVLTP